MKKVSVFFALSCAVALASCGGGNKSAKDENSIDPYRTYHFDSVEAEQHNFMSEYSDCVNFGDSAAIEVFGSNIQVILKPTILDAAELISDKNNMFLLLLDENGDELISLDYYLDWSDFDKALYSGDTSFDQEVSFSKYASTMEDAHRIAQSAKYFSVHMPLVDKPEEPEKVEEPVEEPAEEETVEETEEPEETVEAVEAAPAAQVGQADSNWNPEGEYTLEDNGGKEYTLTLKKGGKAILKKANGGESTGKWSLSGDKKYVTMDFFTGPLILIGSHEYFTSPVLTRDYLYYDRSAYQNDTDCLEVTKIDD